MKRGVVALAGLGLAALVHAPSARASDDTPDPREVAAEIDQLDKGVQSVDDQLTLVEHSYVDRMRKGNAESLEQRFGKGELHFLLQDYVAASVFLFDVVLNPQFQSSPHYLDGVYYLGESLFRQKDYLGAKQFLRQVIEAGPGRGHFEDALARYLDIAARTNDFRDMDRYVALARQGGHLTAVIQYLLAKAAFNRTDLSPADRLGRAVRSFASIPPGSQHLKALYFTGVCHVEMGELAHAQEDFTQVTRSQDNDPADPEIRELGWLALGRIDYELGHYDEALDAYERVPESSSAFYDALYEIAWTYVKKGDFENANRATDLIILGAPEGRLTPSANLLKAHLLLKLHKYADAEEAYNGVINKYAPVRDEIDALLKVHDDPAAYFDQLLQTKGKSFDVATLLPPVAQPWATSQRDVAEAQEVVTDLHDSRQGVEDGQQIVTRLDQRIASAGAMDAFPALQAGYARASAVDTALLGYERQILSLEQSLLGRFLSPGDRQALAAAQTERAELQQKFDALPKTPGEVDARRGQMVSRLAGLDRQLFRLSLVVQSERAQLVAVQQMQAQTAAQRRVNAADEARFSGQIQAELSTLDELDGEVGQLRAVLKDDSQLTGAAGAPQDAQLRQAYAAAVQRESDLLARARQGAGGQLAASEQRLVALRDRISGLRSRDAAAIGSIRQAALDQAAIIKQKIAIEAKNLDEYGGEVSASQANAGGLVGRIAFASFQRVRQSFYQLVLKADVGIIDVAWTRKHDETDKIQRLATDEDRELRVLDDDFKEVLGDVK